MYQQKYLGHSILHRIVELDPSPHAMQAVVEAYPPAVTKQNVGKMPLL
jgi:hypothetical protein